MGDSGLFDSVALPLFGVLSGVGGLYIHVAINLGFRNGASVRLLNVK